MTNPLQSAPAVQGARGNPLEGGNGGAPELSPKGVVQPGAEPAVSGDAKGGAATGQVRHGTSERPHPIEGRDGFIRSYSQVQDFLGKHGVPFATQMSNSSTEMHGPSSSVYFRIEHPTDPTTLRLSNHDYGPTDVDMRYGIPSHQAEGMIASRLGLPMTPDAASYIRERDAIRAEFDRKVKADQIARRGQLDKDTSKREADAAARRDIDANNARIRAARIAKRDARKSAT